MFRTIGRGVRSDIHAFREDRRSIRPVQPLEAFISTSKQNRLVTYMKDGTFGGAPSTLEHVLLKFWLWDVTESRKTAFASGTATCVANSKEISPIKTDVTPLLKKFRKEM